MRIETKPRFVVIDFLPLILVLAALFVAYATDSSAHTSSDKKLYDKSNNVMGYINGSRVEDKNHNLIGHLRSGRTYDKSGRIVSYSELPGLLFCGKN